MPAACAAIAALALVPAYAELRVWPPSPAAGSTVTITGMTGCMGSPNFFEYSLEKPRGSTDPLLVGIIKIYDPIYLDPPLLPCPQLKKSYISVGPLAAGRYQIERSYYGGGLEVATFEVSNQRNATFPADLNGLWWSTAEPGWGVTIYRDPSTGHVFAAWFTHDTSSSFFPALTFPVWVVAPDMSMEGDFSGLFLQTNVSGTLYKALANRGQLNAGPPFQITSTVPVGTLKINFTSTTQATMTYSIDAQFLGPAGLQGPATAPRQGTISLQKAVF